MKRAILLTLTAILSIAVLSATAAVAADGDYFPMDKGRVWAYDDGAVETIVGFTTIELPAGGNSGDRGQIGGEKNGNRVQVFIFDRFNHEKRAFYHIGNKVYEWAENNQRLWYDFDAEVGDTWKVAWSQTAVSLSNTRDSRLTDINDGATMTLLAKDAAVKTPLGEYTNCHHFRLEREGVADAGYVEEWFAPGVGVVQRLWDTIAGPREQKLIKVGIPDVLQRQYRMDVKLDKEIYETGEDISIEVSVLNWSDREITLNFPSALQVDYVIDDDYRYSDNHDFTQAETTVTIPARDVVKWTFIHTPDDWPVPAGYHVVTAELVGTDLAARQKFVVVQAANELPEGLTASGAIGKTEYLLGEPIDFSVTITNTTNVPVTLQLPGKYPVWYAIDDLIRFPAALYADMETEEVVIPANDSVVFEGRHDASRLLIKPGEHTLTLGLTGYGKVAELAFTVTREYGTGTVRGVVLTPRENDTVTSVEDMLPVSGAQVVLSPEVPRRYSSDLANVPVTDSAAGWSTVTADDGTFSFADVPLGMFYILHVRKEGFEPYQQTLRTLDADVELRIVLRPKREHPDKPLNFRNRNAEGLLVAFGTDRTAYKPDSPFRAYMKIHNPGDEAVSFTFTTEDYLVLTLTDAEGTVIWSTDSGSGKQAATAEFQVDIAPRDTYVFTREGSFEGTAAAEGGKFILEGVLDYDTVNIEDFDRATVTGSVRIIVVPPAAQPVEPKVVRTKAELKQMVVDLKEDLKTVIDMTMKNDEAEGEVNVSEIRKNMHTEFHAHRFLKMVEIDADDTIRENLEEAVVRIYYDESELPDDVDPTQLVIAHWHEAMSLDSDDEPSWEQLQSRVDTVNKFVEAVTVNFSSFGLFVPGEPTYVADEAAPVEFSLAQNSPNPFNPATFIEFAIPASGNVKLTVFNVMGQVVATLADGYMAAGRHRIMFDGSSQASGVYFYRLTAPGYTATRKMLLVK